MPLAFLIAGVGLGAGGALYLSDSARRTALVVGVALIAYRLAR